MYCIVLCCIVVAFVLCVNLNLTFESMEAVELFICSFNKKKKSYFAFFKQFICLFLCPIIDILVQIMSQLLLLTTTCMIAYPSSIIHAKIGRLLITIRLNCIV